jgi:hypothetical protein
MFWSKVVNQSIISIYWLIVATSLKVLFRLIKANINWYLNVLNWLFIKSLHILNLFNMQGFNLYLEQLHVCYFLLLLLDCFWICKTELFEALNLLILIHDNFEFRALFSNINYFRRLFLYINDFWISLDLNVFFYINYFWISLDLSVWTTNYGIFLGLGFGKFQPLFSSLRV